MRCVYQWSVTNQSAASFLHRVLVDATSDELRKLVDRDNWSFSNPLPSSDSIEPRYGNVPTEAFPFMNAGVDGCHYALWIDDEASETPPSVVWICPMDGTPETVQPVATTVQEFQSLILGHGLWLHDAAVHAGNELLAGRQQVARHRTRDRFGVVCPDEPAVDYPSEQQLREWSDLDNDSFQRAVSGWLDAGNPGLALAVARDLIADFYAVGISGFGAALADIYAALNRPVLGAIARLSYTQDTGNQALLAEFVNGIDE